MTDADESRSNFDDSSSHCSTLTDTDESKLPEFATPLVYSIMLIPSLESATFSGVSTITLKITEKTDFLRLHVKDLDVGNISIELSSGQVFKNLDEEIDIDETRDFLTVFLPVEIEPQSITLVICFQGKLNNGVQGFIRSKYTDSTGAEKYMAFTQFEGFNARSAFPCWDEPLYKAKFNIALQVNDNLTALSNMNVIEEEEVGKTKLVKFKQTPMIPPYLVAFAVGELEYIETKSKGGVVVRVYTIPGKKQQAKYALNIAAKCLDWYAVWFGIPCPLPKCDLIAVPFLFMDAFRSLQTLKNWGIITFREGGLLINPINEITSSAFIAKTLAHELAYFWFGNYVTMQWWTDHWVKEGFAWLMEYLFIESCCSKFVKWYRSVKHLMENNYMLYPFLPEGHFDSMGYYFMTLIKCNSVMHMVWNYLGSKIFRRGFRIIIKKMAFMNFFPNSNAEMLDLWKALGKASNQKVSELVSSWKKQMGTPLVIVEQKINGRRRHLKLTQEQLLMDDAKININPVWHIPINVVSDDSPLKTKKKFLFMKTEQKFVVDDVNPDGWIKLNAFIPNTFHVQYSSEMLKSLFSAIQSKQMKASDRISLSIDLLALFFIDKVDVVQFLEFIEACDNEDEFEVWSAIDHAIARITNFLIHCSDETLQADFDAFICRIMLPLAQTLGWTPAEDEDAKIGLLRALIQERLAKCGHTDTIQHALKLFVDHADNKVDIADIDLRAVLYGVAGRSNDPAQIERLKKIFETTESRNVQEICVSTMSQCSDEALLRDIFNYGIEQEKISPQLLPQFFLGSQVSKTGKEIAWKFLKDNWMILMNKLNSVHSSMFSFVLMTCGGIQLSEDAEYNFERFARLQVPMISSILAPDVMFQNLMKAAVVSIRNNRRLPNNNANAIREFLASRDEGIQQPKKPRMSR